jgi:hypothetical protein
MDTPDVDVLETVAARLRGRRSHEFDWAVGQAVLLGPSGDHLLAAALAHARGSQAVTIVAALGDVSGDAGAAALRSVLATSGPGSRDLRCAALVSLTKRVGAAATSDLVSALGSRDSAVREYALLCLARAGDERGWDDVLAWLVTLLKRTPTKAGFPASVGIAVVYLTRHCQPGSARFVALVTTLRARWHQSPYEQGAWLASQWPEVRPDGPDPVHVPLPSSKCLASWGNETLFEPWFPLHGG